MNESETCRQLIEPALQTAGWSWDRHLRLGPGRVNISGGSMYDSSQELVLELDMRKSKTTNVCAVYYKSLQTLPIPFPQNRAEQEAITAFLQQIETTAIAMEEQFAQQESDYPALRESILREAFAGNL